MGDNRDDDPTPREKPPRAGSKWGDEERAEVGREHRAGESARNPRTPTEIRRQRARRDAAHPFGVPVQPLPHAPQPDPTPDPESTGETGSGDEVTSPMALLLDRELEPSDLEQVVRLRRDSSDPYEQLYKLAKDLSRVKQREKSSTREQEAKLRELLDRPPREVANKIVSDVSTIKKVAIWLGLALLGTLGTVAKMIYDRGAHDTAIDLRIEQQRDDLRELRESVKHLERMNERDLRDRDQDWHPSAPPLPTTKGPNP